jgi:glycosyltransferase involved in cell wall biosynthesis
MGPIQFTSVIVPAFNTELFIGRCLRSLLHQSVNNDSFEIIIIDDGSNDRTSYAISQFCDPYESLIQVITNDKNIGLPASLNKGILAAKGDYLVRVDSDDYVSSHFIEFLRFYLDSNNSADAVACDYVTVDDNENTINRFDSSIMPIGCGIMFHKHQLIDCGMYDPEFLCHEERELRFRFEKKYKIEHLRLPLYRYREHENGITKNSKLMQKYKNKLISKHGSKVAF